MLWPVEPVPSASFLQGNPADPGHKHCAARRWQKEGGRLRAHGRYPPDLALPQSEGVKKQQPCCKTQESFREVGKSGKPARVGELYSVFCPPFQPKAHGARYLRENGDADLSSRVWRETSKQRIETVRAGMDGMGGGGGRDECSVVGWGERTAVLSPN